MHTRSKLFFITTIVLYCTLSLLLMSPCASSTVDFLTFYNSLVFHHDGEIPYRFLNLNPPFFFYLFKWLAYFKYNVARLIWTVCSVFLFYIQAQICLKLLKPEQRDSLNLSVVYFLFFCSYPVLMHLVVGQMTSVIGLLLIWGFQQDLKNKSLLTGISWGLVCAIKLFPLLLIFYLLSEKKFKALGILLTTFICISAIPLVLDGAVIYKQYFFLLRHINWYHNSWNASLMGLVFKTFWLHGMPSQLSYLLMVCSKLLIVLGFAIYAWLINLSTKPSQKFCLTLGFMILLSPLGWIYYLPLVLYPMLLLWGQLRQYPNGVLLWLLSYILLSFPTANLSQSHLLMSSTQVLFFLSFNTYGLILLIYLLTKFSSLSAPFQRINTSIPSLKQQFLFSFILCLLFIAIMFSIHYYHSLFLYRRC